MQRGPYWFVRHPIHLSFVLLGIGFVLLAQNLIIFLLVGFFNGAVFPRQEEELLERLGEAYRAYQGRAGRFFPRIRPRT